MSVIQQAKNLGLYHNVSVRVIDATSGNIVSEHIGHNNATNSMITGMGHYLKGDGVWNQGHDMLNEFIPRYMSLGTMGLLSQDQDIDGYPTGLGERSYRDITYSALSRENLSVLKRETFNPNDIVSEEHDELLRLVDYLYHRPGFGADGYDQNSNNGRIQFGLGLSFDHPLRLTKSCIQCELVSSKFLRSPITFRDLVPENQSEIPSTIDVVLSAMISTGSLSKFRDTDKDYTFITEVGLWSSPDYNDSGANGLLAGYRLSPSNSSDWDLIDPVKRSTNIDKIKRSIIKVKKNQIVQVIWKIQLGSVDQFGGIDKLYPEKINKYWNTFSDDVFESTKEN